MVGALGVDDGGTDILADGSVTADGVAAMLVSGGGEAGVGAVWSRDPKRAPAPTTVITKPSATAATTPDRLAPALGSIGARGCTASTIWVVTGELVPPRVGSSGALSRRGDDTARSAGS